MAIYVAPLSGAQKPVPVNGQPDDDLLLGDAGSIGAIPLVSFDSMPSEPISAAHAAAVQGNASGNVIGETPVAAAGTTAAAGDRTAAAIGAALAASGVTPAVVDGPFIQLGPSPSSNWPWGTASGAVQAIVTDPGDVSTMWIGATDGGIWVTHNGGASWTPLTDKQASLSIGALNLDPTDASHNTLLAGIGQTSNGAVIPAFLRGGPQTGLLYSTNGGTSWASLGSVDLAGQNIIGVIARGQTMLAASFDEWNVRDGLGGLFRSTDGGTNFTQVTAFGSGAVSSLVGDPTDTSKLYAAVTSIAPFASTAVYVSSDTGANWTQVFGAAQSNGLISSSNQTFLRVAVNGSEIAVGVVHVDPTNQFNAALAGLFLSTDSGSTWTPLAVPSINSGGQADTNFAIALDPTTPGVVYVTGDSTGISPFGLAAFMVTTSGATSITDSGTKNSTTAHADSRAIAFDANGRLILGSDGGVYARTDPTSTTNGDWSGLNGSNLSLEEPYALAFDGNSDRLLIAAQDNGVAFENSPGSQAFSATIGGDGVNAAINDQIAGSSNSALYASVQNYFGPIAGTGHPDRKIVSASGAVLGQAAISFSTPLASIGFSASFIVNSIDPSRLAFSANDIYVTQDTQLNNTAATSITLTVTDIGTAANFANGPFGNALAYGTLDNVQAVLAGGDGSAGDLFLSTATTPAGGTLTAVAAYPGAAPSGVAFDLRTEHRFFVADQTSLWGTIDTGGSFTDLTSNLTPLNLFQPTKVAFISNNGVNALLVGGIDSAANVQSPIAVADSDSSGTLTNWRLFGTGLPNTYVNALNYDMKSDTLAVGMWGRGGWVEYDVTSNFSSATVLQFGLANNDSAPDASLLTGSRALQKYGTGTLTIGGAATYSLGSTINAGTMQINSGGSVTGTIAFNGTSGSLGLANDSGFTNTISNLNVGTSGAKTSFIDIEGHTVTIGLVTGQGTANGSIHLSDGTVLNLTNLNSPAWFANATGDGASGTDVYVSDTACYCRGTPILTDAGEVAIEALAIGDRVVTLSGAARPIKWIGRRAYDPRFIAGNRGTLPVRVMAGALADGVPACDLWVSPCHSLYVEGVLVPAQHLLNGATIAQADSVETLEYFHLELETHDVIFAAGAPAETFVDCDNRGMFHNARDFAALYPDDVRQGWRFCAPRLEWELDGAQLDNIRARLFARAEALGYGLDRDPVLRLVVDEEIVEPESAAPRHYTFRIPAGSCSVSLASRNAAPIEIEVGARDIRRLGVPVERLVLRDADLSVDMKHTHPALQDGFHAAEAAHRWTDGRGRLPDDLLCLFAGEVTIDVHLAPSVLRYRVAPEAAGEAAAA